jgi:hypothetical protein
MDEQKDNWVLIGKDGPTKDIPPGVRDMLAAMTNREKSILSFIGISASVDAIANRELARALWIAGTQLVREHATFDPDEWERLRKLYNVLVVGMNPGKNTEWDPTAELREMLS